MKKSVIKAVSLCLCGALAIGGAGVRALAQGNEAEESAKPVPAAGTTGSAARPSARDETVYVLTGSDGSVEKVIVSDWLKNGNGSAVLADAARLEDVENVKDGASYTLDGDTRVWDAQGKDLYTQGTTDEPLPVDMTVRYTLDGRAVTPEELAGKSGRVAIRFDYTNNAYQMMEVDGEQQKIYVPFAMLTGVALDNEIFRNVEAVNGRVYNDGDRTAVVGMAFPGLQESLDVDPGKLEIPDYVEIRADVTGFEMGITLTVASGGLFGELDTEKLDEAEGLNGSLEELTDAMDRLHDGLNTLLESANELSGGIGQLAAGAEALKTGTEDLGTGAEQLRQGAGSLSAGLDALDGNSAALNAGAKQVFDTLLASASGQLTAAGVQLPAELTAENYGKILEGVLAAMPEGAAGPVLELKASLDSYNQFYQGLQGYTAGVAQAAQGAGALQDGAAQLSGGAAQLSEGAARLSGGLGTLQSSVPALVDGVTQLRDGSKELAGGLDEFNREGVQKLVDAVDGDLEGLVERLKAAAEASRNYRSFSGDGEAPEDQVKFIYRTAPVQRAE